MTGRFLSKLVNIRCKTLTLTVLAGEGEPIIVVPSFHTSVESEIETAALMNNFPPGQN
jgi:hypothetical protein